VRVEGHTDDEPARSLPFPDNWGVGSTRAVNVGRFMVLDGGMSPDRLELATRSFHDPRAEGRTVAARARNRRVEIVVPPIAPR
jgi:flagellar motor protein MotB